MKERMYTASIVSTRRPGPMTIEDLLTIENRLPPAPEPRQDQCANCHRPMADGHPVYAGVFDGMILGGRPMAWLCGSCYESLRNAADGPRPSRCPARLLGLILALVQLWAASAVQAALIYQSPPSLGRIEPLLDCTTGTCRGTPNQVDELTIPEAVRINSLTVEFGAWTPRSQPPRCPVGLWISLWDATAAEALWGDYVVLDGWTDRPPLATLGDPPWTLYRTAASCQGLDVICPANRPLWITLDLDIDPAEMKTINAAVGPLIGGAGSGHFVFRMDGNILPEASGALVLFGVAAMAFSRRHSGR